MSGISLAGFHRIAIATGVVAAVACGLQACGGLNRSNQLRTLAPQTHDSTPGGAAQGLPAFPGETPVGNLPEYRRTSAGQITILGTDKVDQGGAQNYVDPGIGGAYVIIPGGDDDLLAWARYDIDNLDLERPVSLDLHVTAAPIIPGGDDDLPLNYWIGVGDYTRSVWEWHGPYTATNPNIELNDKGADILDRYISASHVMRLVVLTFAEAKWASETNPLGLTAARIETITVNTLEVGNPAYVSTRPHYAGIDGVGPGGGKKGSMLDPDTQYVHITWTHVLDPNDTSSETFMYMVYRQGPTDLNMVHIGSQVAPSTEYIDPTNNVPGVPEAIPGVTYKYALRALNPAGYTPFDEITYTIPIQQPPAIPANVLATDGVFTDKVTITWDAVYGADIYRILRATDVSGPYDPVGTDINAPITTADDTSANPGIQYWYKVVAGNEVGMGLESSEDGGWRKLSPTNWWKPEDFKGSAGTYVGLTWDEAPGATDYFIYRSVDNSGIGELIQSTVTDVVWNDHPPLLGENYYYTVVPNCPLGSADLNDCFALQARGWTSPPKPPTGVHAEDAPGDSTKWLITFTRPSPRDYCLFHLFYYIGASPPDGRSVLWTDTGGQTASSSFVLPKTGYPPGQYWFAVQTRRIDYLPWDAWDFNSDIIPSDVSVNN